MPRLILVLVFAGLIGCAQHHNFTKKSPHSPAPPSEEGGAPVQAPSPRHANTAIDQTGAVDAGHSGPSPKIATAAAHDEIAAAQPLFDAGTVAPAGWARVTAEGEVISSPPPAISASGFSLLDEDETGEIVPVTSSDDTLPLNLPTALAMIDGEHPLVGFAQWRIQEANAQLARAKILWLPSLQPGFSFHRHDGNLQSSDGAIVDVNRNSFGYGLGTGAVGAGTQPQPGVVARFHLADAIFQPEIAEQQIRARTHGAKAVVNRQLLAVALAYIELLDAHQDLRILEESRSRVADLYGITRDFAEAGEGPHADADRLRTELALVENRLVSARENAAIASARLAQALSLDSNREILPMDVTLVPLELLSLDSDRATLIRTGLCARPELKESQAMVATVCEAYDRERAAPFVPSVLLGYSAGGFGGGLGSDLDNVDGRYDFDAMLSWEVRNLGFGEAAARREAHARVQQARFEQARVMDEVAREISESHSRIGFRREQMTLTQNAIQPAKDSYRLNLERIREGQGLPLEVLQSVQALEAAHQAHLRAVTGYNEAQFQLQWSIGWPVSAPTSS